MKKFTDYQLVIEKKEIERKKYLEVIHLPELSITKESLNEYLKLYNLKLEELK